jgi:DeoR family transcriptional regulator, ulaG and ulaABCDEF operon transcriptional repressor
VNETGVLNNDSLVIQAERSMIRNAGKLVLLVDSRKFGEAGLLLLCRLKDVDVLVTDTGIPDHYRAMIRSVGVELIEVSP